MTALICPRCRSANPQEAYYCHHDGVLLEDVKETKRAKSDFPTPFVFKSGVACKDFKSLGQGILVEWDSSREMLAFAEWESFFTGLGRNDLTQIASQARMFPDPDRGLDQMISALPGFEAKPGLLRINQKTVNFGTIITGKPVKQTLILENDGDRLIWGEAILKDTPWCSLSGEGPLADRTFKFIKSMSLEIQITPANVRRSGRTLTGTLILKTDSGETTIQLIAKEPDVIPFDEELFFGATSPRQIAEKSRSKPREAAPLFLSGKVAKWYEANGWSYPVIGPTAPGMASVQQYFEAHGFAPAPKVIIEPPKICLQVNPGEPAKQSLVLKTSDKRHVFGYLMPTESWIQAGDLEPNYQSATIPLIFETKNLCPAMPLRTNLIVIANGQQRFEIPVEIHALAAEAHLLDLDSIGSQSNESVDIEFSSVELLEGGSVEEESNLLEADFIKTPLTNPNQKLKPLPINGSFSQNLNLSFSPPSGTELSASDSKQIDLHTKSIIQTFANPVGDNAAIESDSNICNDISNSDNRNTDVLAKKINKRNQLMIGVGAGAGTVLLAVLAFVFVFRAGTRSDEKHLVRPISAGKPSTDLMGFTIETTDPDHISLLATEAADNGSHFMLKSGNTTVSVNSKKNSPKTITKWENKDGWSHREIEMSVGINKWKVGQWLRTMPSSPNQCAILFELSPLERDSKIAARLAMRPGTGTGTSVNLLMPNSGLPFKKPTLFRGEKMPEQLLFSIDSPPINCMFGFELPEMLLPGKEKPSVPSRPAQLLVAYGNDSFVPWDCKFPEMFEDIAETSSIGTKLGQPNDGASVPSFKDPFVSIYWDEATVRKGQNRIIGFKLGLAGVDGMK